MSREDGCARGNIKTREFTIKMNRCEPPKLFPYKSDPVEFDLLKRYKMIASQKINKQKVLIDKIDRGKFKYMADANPRALRALASNDLRILVDSRIDLEQRISTLRQKIHEDAIGDCRVEDFQAKDTQARD